MRKTRIILADDHAIVREGLKRLLADRGEVEVVAEARDGREVMQQVRSVEADVLVMGITMPGPGFVETMRRLRDECPGLRVLVLGVHTENHYILQAFKAGAAGYLTRADSSEQLWEALRRIGEGRTYVTPEVAERLAADLRDASFRLPHDLLSQREFEIFRLLVAGKCVKEIATELGLSPKTVSTYRTRVLKKLHLKTIVDLVRYALEHGLAS